MLPNDKFANTQISPTGGYTTGPVAPPSGGMDDRLDNTVGVLPAANEWFQNPGMGYYPGQTQAGFNPMQEQGWQNSLQGANNIRDAGAGLSQGFGQWLNGGGTQANASQAGNQAGMNYFDNPFLHQSVSDASGQMQQNFDRNINPAIKMQAAAAGGMGGSRRQIATGLAASDLQEQQGRMANQAYQQNYSQGVQAFNQARGQDNTNAMNNARMGTQASVTNANNDIQRWNMAPGMFNMFTQSQMYPGGVMGNIGNQWQNQAQGMIGGEVDRWNFNRDNPLDRLNSYNNIVGSQTGSGTTTNSSGPGPNYGNIGAGIAEGGAQLGNFFGGGGSPIPPNNSVGGGGSNFDNIWNQNANNFSLAG